MNADYPSEVTRLLESLKKDCASTVAEVARRTVETVDGGGLIYVFGAGHSSILAEEAFHRAGGLIPVHPILHDFLSPRIPPKVAGKMERLEGVAKILFERGGARKGDLMWIASNSGINAAAIEMAQASAAAGARTVALTSLAHSKATASRHSSGKKLFELCDHVLDNHCPPGDALVDAGGARVAAGSTIANSFLYHWALAEACALWTAAGKSLPIYVSANLPGGDAANEKAEARYRARIPLL
ncbi:MAG: SIS domain-containing protein [Deltaproteobacteria bacterium]|nr:SIS domain-containing protein [Deltaproteobacteria bacterium]